jgi:(R)-amidase
VQALLAQLASAPGDLDANVAGAVAAIGAHPQVDIAIFPELYLGGYDLALVSETARTSDCRELATLARAAAEASTAVVVGFAERLDDGTIANSAACIDRDGSLAGVYRKLQLFGPEREVFRPGAGLRIVRLAGIDVGLLICFDVEFPELARALALGGATLLVTPSANMDPFVVDHEIASRARALENHLPHLYVNGVGSPGGLQLVGHSRSIDAGGAILGETASNGSMLLVAPIGAAGPTDDRIDYLRDLPTEVRILG